MQTIVETKKLPIEKSPLTFLVQLDENQTKTCESTSTDIVALLANARVLMKHQEWHLAINLLRKATFKDSKNLAVIRLLCECLATVGNLDELLSVQIALAKFSISFETIFEVANTYYKLGDDNNALRSYFECLALMQDDPDRLFEIYKNLGNIFVRQRDFEGAEEYFNRAFTLDRQADLILVNLGTLEVQRESFDRALEYFRQAIAVNSQSDRAWIGLALVHNYYGDHELAWGNIERALDINPTNVTALQLYASWGLRRQEIEAPLELLMGVINQIEPDSSLSLLMIQMLLAKGRTQLALMEAERALLLDPGNKDLATVFEYLRNGEQTAQCLP